MDCGRCFTDDQHGSCSCGAFCGSVLCDKFPFPMADAEEIGMEAIFEARRLTELDAVRVRRRPWLTP